MSDGSCAEYFAKQAPWTSFLLHKSTPVTLFLYFLKQKEMSFLKFLYLAQGVSPKEI